MRTSAFNVRPEGALKRTSTLVFLPEGGSTPTYRGALETHEGGRRWVYRDLRPGPHEGQVLFTVGSNGAIFLDSVVSADGVAVGGVEWKILRLVRTKWVVKQGERRFVGRERWLLVALLRDVLPWLLSSTFDLKDEHGRRVARFVLERGVRPGIHAYTDDESLDLRLAVTLAAQMARLEG